MKFDICSRLDFEEPETIRKEQFRLLNEHVAYCRKHSPFYREKLKGFPDKPVTPESLRDLPFTSKSDFSEHNGQLVAVPHDQISDICFTSGTTGAPCRVCYTKNDLQRLGYNDAMGYLAAGMRSGDRVLLTCTIDRCFIAGLAYYSGVVQMGGAAIRNGLNTLESHAEILKISKPDAIVGVPSFLAKLGACLESMNCDRSSVRTLICIGEPLRDKSMELTPLGRKLEQFFPGAAHSTYASSEMVTSFTECSARAGGHPPADIAVVEIVDDDGNVLQPGEIGEVVVTPLQVTGMPLIRFRTGDVSFQIPEPHCACGRNTLRLGPILGRKRQMMKIRGTTLFPNAFFSVLDGIKEVSEYYLEVSGTALSDEVRVFAATDSPDCPAEKIRDILYGRIRIHVPVELVGMEAAKKENLRHFPQTCAVFRSQDAVKFFTGTGSMEENLKQIRPSRPFSKAWIPAGKHGDSFLTAALQQLRRTISEADAGTNQSRTSGRNRIRRSPTENSAKYAVADAN